MATYSAAEEGDLTVEGIGAGKKRARPVKDTKAGILEREAKRQKKLEKDRLRAAKEAKKQARLAALRQKEQEKLERKLAKEAEKLEKERQKELEKERQKARLEKERLEKLKTKGKGKDKKDKEKVKREPGVENEDPEDDDDDDDDRDDGNGMDTGTDDGSGSGGVPPAPVVKPEPLTPKQLKAKEEELKRQIEAERAAREAYMKQVQEQLKAQADAAKRAEEERLKAFQEEQERLRKEAAAREERLKEKIALTLRPSDGQDPIKIVVARKVLVSKLLETAAKERGYALSDIRLLLDGQRLNPAEMIIDTGLNDGDEIDIMVQQSGGATRGLA